MAAASAGPGAAAMAGAGADVAGAGAGMAGAGPGMASAGAGMAGAGPPFGLFIFPACVAPGRFVPDRKPKETPTISHRNPKETMKRS